MLAHASTDSAIPNWVRWLFTAYMAVLVPIYWLNYGWTNFLYFCDVAMFLTLFAVWRNNSLAASIASVGILIPQLFWCVDFGFELAGVPLTTMTSYMFDASKPLYLRLLSLFHGWLPFLLIYLVWKLGYDRRALWGWTLLSCVLCLVAFFLMPPAGATEAFPSMPRNINYVFGLDDSKPQTMLSPGLYLVAWMLGLFVAFNVPTHFLLRAIAPAVPVHPEGVPAGALPNETHLVA